MGNAVLRAASRVRQQVLNRAAKKLEVPAKVLDIKEGIVFVKEATERRISVAEVARDFIYNFKGEVSQITWECTWEPKGNPPPFQSAFAEVEVDTEAGEVRVLKMVIAHDIGTAINPITVEGQLEGSIIQGIGYELIEDYFINKDNGCVESDNFTTYKIPSSLDIPETEVFILEEPSPSGPFGAKSVGESGMITIAPAIANAIYNAVGMRITEMPVTPEKIINALRSK